MMCPTFFVAKLYVLLFSNHHSILLAFRKKVTDMLNLQVTFITAEYKNDFSSNTEKDLLDRGIN